MDESPKDPKNAEGENRFVNTVRDIVSVGMATYFMTEEGVKNYLKEKKLPTELVSGLLETFSKRKDDLYSVVGKEVGSVLSKIDISKEVGRFLENHKIKFDASVSFEKKNSPKDPNEKS